jgi:predicted SAM-dependent methyltransferase
MSTLNIEFGAGGSRPIGWVTHDIDVPIQGPLPYGDNSVDKIRAEHIIEHTDSVGLIAFLESCYRILKPGGVLRICVPAIGKHLTREHARDLAINHTHQHIHTPQTISLALWISGFDSLNLREVPRDSLDHHWTVIGAEQDDLETYRCEVTK